MLSRTASSLYWLGRYIERADFIARLVEATVRLDVLSSRPAGEAAWQSALARHRDRRGVRGDRRRADDAERGRAVPDARHRRIPGSIVRCLDMARDNARAVRTALTREAWTAINRAWLIVRQARVGRRRDRDAEAGRGGARPRRAGSKARSTGCCATRRRWFIRLGQAIERADNTARLLDVKYHLLLPEGEQVGGVVDRDQWTTILQTVSAVTAYRWLYSDGLRPANVIDLLIARAELPRSLAASVEETVELLGLLARRTGLHGEADRMARMRAARLAQTRSGEVIASGCTNICRRSSRENDQLHARDRPAVQVPADAAVDRPSHASIASPRRRRGSCRCCG